MTALPPMTVTFDDGTEVRIEPKMRDIVGAEAAGHDFTVEGRGGHATWATAFAVLKRLERKGELPDGLVVPATLQEFLDAADVEPDDDEDVPDPKG